MIKETVKVLPSSILQDLNGTLPDYCLLNLDGKQDKPDLRIYFRPPFERRGPPKPEDLVGKGVGMNLLCHEIKGLNNKGNCIYDGEDALFSECTVRPVAKGLELYSVKLFF